jgi:hypothetical protein
MVNTPPLEHSARFGRGGHRRRARETPVGRHDHKDRVRQQRHIGCPFKALATLHVLLGHATHPVTKRDGALDKRRRESHAFRAPLSQKWGFGAAPGTLTVIGLSAKEVRG